MISAVPDIYEGILFEKERLIMMSDGGYEQFSNFEICNFFLCSESSISSTVKNFMKKCEGRSTFDNVSIIGIEIMNAK